jgi:hypothetical protein
VPNDFPTCAKEGKHMGNTSQGTQINKDKVININDKEYEMASYFLGIDIMIKMTSREFGVNKKVVHFGIPRLGSLLKTIKRFLKATKNSRVILDIARRSFHVDFFLQISLQEGRFNIHLMGVPFM